MHLSTSGSSTARYKSAAKKWGTRKLSVTLPQGPATKQNVNVTIQERKFSFRSEFDISAPSGSFYARKSLVGNGLQLQNRNGQDIVRLRSRLSFLRNKYDFEFTSGAISINFNVKNAGRVSTCAKATRTNSVCINTKVSDIPSFKTTNK